MEKIQTCMFLCFYVNLTHNESAQKSICFLVHFSFSAYFYPSLHHNGKGSNQGSRIL